MLQFYELIELKRDDRFAYFVTNNIEYQGKVAIPVEKVANFEDAVRGDRLTADKWDDRRVDEQDRV